MGRYIISSLLTDSIIHSLQLAALQAIVATTSPLDFVAPNFRPTQPLYERTVYSNEPSAFIAAMPHVLPTRCSLWP